MAEWSRRQTRNLVGSALVGSNPAGVDFTFPKSFLRDRHGVRHVRKSLPPWRNGYRVPLLRERLRVRIPQGVFANNFLKNKHSTWYKHSCHVEELAWMPERSKGVDSSSTSHYDCVGSNPTSGIFKFFHPNFFFFKVTLGVRKLPQLQPHWRNA